MSLSCHVRARRGDFTLDFGFDAPVSSVAVVGPSGAGKSSLLLGLAGLIETESVSLKIDGETIIAPGDRTPPHRRGLGYMFQDGRLFPHMTVADNVGFGNRYGQSSLGVEEALGLVDLGGFESRWPASLSGGEARRVALARVLATAPRVLLLDEPFSGLDPVRRAGLLPYLLRLRDVVRVPMILISHNPRDASDLCEFVAHIRDGTADQTV